MDQRERKQAALEALFELCGEIEQSTLDHRPLLTGLWLGLRVAQQRSKLVDDLVAWLGGWNAPPPGHGTVEQALDRALERLPTDG